MFKTKNYLTEAIRVKVVELLNARRMFRGEPKTPL
jgi:hypothetical protein